MSDRELREAICDIGRRLHERGFVAAFDGNISQRLPNGLFLCTPTHCPKGRLIPQELCVVDVTGQQACGSRPRTSEILLHLVIYRERPDVQAVVHAHPPHATAFAMTGKSVPKGILAEVEYFLGAVPTAPYETPGTTKFAESVVPYLKETRALILANHGTVTFAPTLELAWAYTEILDAYCRVLLLSSALGEPKKLAEKHIAELVAMRRRAELNQ